MATHRRGRHAQTAVNSKSLVISFSGAPTECLATRLACEYYTAMQWESTLTIAARHVTDDAQESGETE
jgi:hypothetical protein